MHNRRRLLAALLATVALQPAAAMAQSLSQWDPTDGTYRVKGLTTPVGNTFTTPAGVSAYAAGQLIANSATAGSVVPMTFAVCTVAGGSGAVIGARVKTTDTGFAGKKVILKLHRDAPTFTNGDHGTWISTEAAALPPISITLSEHFSDQEKGTGTPDNNGTANGRSMFGFDCGPGLAVIYGELVAGEAITPQGGKVFGVVLEAVH